MNCWFILLKYVLDSFCYCHDLFLISKICMLSTSFFKWKLICIFLRCKFEFFSNKKPICVFLRCRFEFLSNQKLIWIFLRYRSEFFSNKNLLASSLDANLNFSQKKKKNWFVSSLDTNLNFSYLKNWYTFSLGVDLIFLNIADFE